MAARTVHARYKPEADRIGAYREHDGDSAARSLSRAG